MSGSLILLDRQEVSATNTGQVILSGITSEYHNFFIVGYNLQADTDAVQLVFRLMSGGTEKSTSNYAYSNKVLKSHTTFSHDYDTGINFGRLQLYYGTAGNEFGNFRLHLWNANESNEYTMWNEDSANRDPNGNSISVKGGGVYRVLESHDALKFYYDTANIYNGTFLLYAYRK